MMRSLMIYVLGYFLSLGKPSNSRCHLDRIAWSDNVKKKTASITKSTKETQKLNSYLNIYQPTWQVYLDMWDTGHTNTQIHMQSTHSVNKNCANMSKGQVHTHKKKKKKKKPVLRSPCMRMDSNCTLLEPQWKRPRQLISCSASSVYNQTIIPLCYPMH